MPDIYCYSYAEDQPSADAAKKLVNCRNKVRANKLLFHDGFPAITHGYGELKKKIPSFMNMARSGICTFIITDLDKNDCVVSLIKNWLSQPKTQNISISHKFIFRVAIHEIESWILADRKEWATYIEIPEANFPDSPDDIEDPKMHLLDIIRRKGRKKYHREMLPKGTSHIGPSYNEVLCRFINDIWSPDRASAHSPSLKRAIEALNKIT